jgi:hypothetical protein
MTKEECVCCHKEKKWCRCDFENVRQQLEGRISSACQLIDGFKQYANDWSDWDEQTRRGLTDALLFLEGDSYRAQTLANPKKLLNVGGETKN